LFKGLPGRQLARRFSPEIVLTMATLVRGFAEAMYWLGKFKPDLVISTGGYVSASVVLAQAVRRGLILIHEQNVIPGRTNLWLSRFASRICLTFEDSIHYFPASKSIVTGLPVRPDLIQLPEQEEARKALGLDTELFTVLVIGGSQGARKLNDVVTESIAALASLPIQILHQSGERNYDEVCIKQKAMGCRNYHVRAYIDEMALAYAAADLVVARCGASTVAEVTCVGLPAIFVPYPYAYADHQTYNGKFVARRGAALLIPEKELTAEKLVDAITKLMTSPETLAKMREASKSLGKPNAAKDIVSLALQMIEEQRCVRRAND
jgi:UDP-N-acetylglucosamine--N-acetylmuramyl-(pentapeptide) pyrophosphoryl-undecaprenol N-acetylglucosamine transferase